MKITAAIITHAQGSEGWDQHRKRSYNASELAVAMGISRHTARSELVRIKATGIQPEHSDFVQQRVFAPGHESEALARPIAQEIMGEELYPCVLAAEVDGLPLSASLDGMDLFDRMTWEHKQASDALLASLAAGVIPEEYHPQMEQGLMLSGAEKCLFMASNGTRDRMESVWYESDPVLRAKIIPTWKQFAADVAAYQPEAPASPAPTGKAPEALPALHIVLKGEVSASNLATFKDVALAAIRSVNRDLQTDQDFADSAKARKWCEDIESKVAAAKEHALGQTASIDELFRAMDEISAEARRVRLELDKLEKARNLAINGEIVADGVKQFADHMKALNAAMPAAYMPSVPVDFGGAIKGLRSVASKKDAVATELARVKIIANEHATRIQANLRTLAERKDMAFLFADVGALVLKAPDDLAAVMAQRVSRHEAEQAAKEEAQRERIRAEEAVKLQREADEKRRAEEAKSKLKPHAWQLADEQRLRAARLEDERIKREQIEQLQAARIRDEELQRQAQAAIAAAATPAPAPVAAPAPAPVAARVSPAIPTDSGARLSLGQINERISPVSINVAGLAALGYEPVEQVKASRLYRESDFSAICAAIVRHVQGVAQGVSA